MKISNRFMLGAFIFLAALFMFTYEGGYTGYATQDTATGAAYYYAENPYGTGYLEVRDQQGSYTYPYTSPYNSRYGTRYASQYASRYGRTWSYDSSGNRVISDVPGGTSTSSLWNLGTYGTQSSYGRYPYTSQTTGYIQPDASGRTPLGGVRTVTPYYYNSERSCERESNMNCREVWIPVIR